MSQTQNGVLVKVRNLVKYFPVTRGLIIARHVADIKAVDDVSFAIHKGETLGLVGESGSGKTTVGKCLLRLYEPTSGQIVFDGVDLCKLDEASLRELRVKMQPIYQDPYSSLNPRHTVADIVSEPLIVHGLASGRRARERVDELLQMVGLDPEFAERYPHMFSGGQRQRIGVARAIATRPAFIVCDEPVSALDVSIQSQIVNLLGDLKSQLNLTLLFISHDLSVVRHISNRIAVMYLGRIVELAPSRNLYDEPLHPYSQALLSAIPIPDPEIEEKRRRIILKGEIPSLLNPPPGCTFHPRCPVAIDICSKQVPEFREISGRWVACHLVK
ncbi:MAG: oligopeptide/dipeptide ABC transporter ATP-binding protein [Chloroflexota bacterium]